MAQSKVSRSTDLVLYQGNPTENLARYIWAIQANYNVYAAQLNGAGDLPALLSLPPELFFEVCQLLSVESQAMLAVTCKSLYHSMFPYTALKYLKHRGSILQCLERQAPGKYYCPACVKLHSWHLSKDGEAVFPAHSDMTTACSVTSWCFPSDPGPYHEVSHETTDYKLDYRTARLAVRAAALGPSFGPPLASLERRGVWQPCAEMVKEHAPLPESLCVTYHYEPRVVDDILHMRATYVMRDATGGPEFWNLWMRSPELAPWLCPGKAVFQEFEGQAGRCRCFEAVSEAWSDGGASMGQCGVEAGDDASDSHSRWAGKVAECRCAKTLAEVCALQIHTIGRCECSTWAPQYCGTEWEMTKQPTPAEAGCWELTWKVWRRFDMLAACGVHEWFRDPYFDQHDEGRWMCPYYGLKAGARRAWLLAEATAEPGCDEQTLARLKRQLDEDEERMTEGDLSDYEDAKWIMDMWEGSGQWFEEVPESIWPEEPWVHWD